MKKYIIANWKSNKTPTEATAWLEEVMEKLPKDVTNFFEIIICPPIVDVPSLYGKMTGNTTLKLGVQDISLFPEGPYTGEVAIRLVSSLISYTLLGHSERRRHLCETDEIVAKKTLLAIHHGLTPIICISDEREIINWENFIRGKIEEEKRKTIIFSYEPLSAISTGSIGRPEEPLQADNFINKIKLEHNITTCIYGGSVDKKNIDLFIKQSHIDGVLAGAASLKPENFLEVVKNALPR